MASIKKNISTKYCKVCQDAGKPESEYRSHFTRESKDPNSKVLCPTLLALECRYCFKTGHTIKYCKILKDNEKNKKRWEQEAQNKKNIIEKEKIINSNEKIVSNKFAYLDDEDSENELEEHISNNFNKNVIEEFPQLTNTPIKNTFGGSNYANALANNCAAPLPNSIPVRMPPLTKKKLSIGEINWADLDSDSDEDEDNYNYNDVQEAYNTYDQKECYNINYCYEEDW